ncbi:dihydrofolate reductase family protein [Nonomuraea wenchangensis]
MREGVSPLFDWYGDVEVPMVGYPITFRVAAAGVGCLREQMDFARYGALVCGRRVFDCIGGWGGDPPGGGRGSVVTHREPPAPRPAERPAPFTLVHDGVSGPDIAQQCRNLGLLGEVRIDLVPVFLGEGIRYIDNIQNEKAELERVEGEGVTHLHYRWQRRHEGVPLAPRAAPPAESRQTSLR